MWVAVGGGEMISFALFGGNPDWVNRGVCACVLVCVF